MTPYDLADQVLRHLSTLSKLPANITLNTYETQLDYATLRPEDQPATVEGHTALIHEVEKILTHKFQGRIKIEIKPLNASAYLRWLAENNLKNTAANRAHFNALQS